MNVGTGQTFTLPQTPGGWPEVGMPIRPSDLPTDSDAAASGLAELERRELEALREEVYADEPVVVVSAAVAHQQRVGQRELGRRARRRAARRKGR